MRNTTNDLKKSDTFFDSKVFPGHIYEISHELGEGGVGIVYAVLLREAATNKIVKLYAAKIVQDAHLQE